LCVPRFEFEGSCEMKSVLALGKYVFVVTPNVATQFVVLDVLAFHCAFHPGRKAFVHRVCAESPNSLKGTKIFATDKDLGAVPVSLSEFCQPGTESSSSNRKFLNGREIHSQARALKIALNSVHWEITR
jgi:hypothetical protein